MENESSLGIIEDYFEEDSEESEEKRLTTEDLKIELERLSQIKNKCGTQSENCLLIKRVALLHKFNESQSLVLLENTDENILKNPSRSNRITSIRSTIIPNNKASERVSELFKLNKFHTIETEELLFSIDNVLTIFNSCNIVGELILTNYKFVFAPRNSQIFEKEFITFDFFQIPYSFVVNVIKKKENKFSHKYLITFQIRDRPQISLGLQDKILWEEIYLRLTELTQPKSIENYFAFNYYRKYERLTEEFENGWNSYRFFHEYLRMGVVTEDPESRYRLYIQEVHGEVCDTYPNFVFIHKNTTDLELEQIAIFRTKKRFPALIWFSKNNNSSLWRSSQAKTGFTDRRNYHDEVFFEQLSKDTEKFHIFDARPYINAFANKIKGLGFENSNHYKNCQIFFCDIDNIHKVKQAFMKMQAVSQLPVEGYDNWLQDLHNTGWLQIISKIMKSSINIVASMLENATVLVHCSDGWDRTPGLTSLAQIIIDPYYRTLQGFSVLIEKDWVSFGHQFAFRNGHSFPREEENVSPVFIQWLDIIHQLLYQFPNLFEFNNDLLLFLSYHVHSCMYGTFLLNCEKESTDNLLKFKTVSIWTDVLRNKIKFINPSYVEKKSIKTILTPNCALYKLRVWEEYFLRWNPYYVMNNSQNIFSPYV